jgi:hypothetical protein
MGLVMKKSTDKSNARPVIGWMERKLKEKQKRIHHLRRLVLKTANRLIAANEAKMASRSALLLGTIRQRDWAQAGQHCATLGRLIEIQVEAERILARHSRRGCLGHQSRKTR